MNQLRGTPTSSRAIRPPGRTTRASSAKNSSSEVRLRSANPHVTPSAEVSGTAHVVGFTVNQHPFLPGWDPPFVIANVALAEDATVRLTTNIVGCEPDEVRIGQEVQVTFEHHEDVWLPKFSPTGGADADVVPEPVRPTPRAPVSDDRFEHRAVLSGIGRSAIRSAQRVLVAHGSGPQKGSRGALGERVHGDQGAVIRGTRSEQCHFEKLGTILLVGPRGPLLQ